MDVIYASNSALTLLFSFYSDPAGGWHSKRWSRRRRMFKSGPPEVEDSEADPEGYKHCLLLLSRSGSGQVLHFPVDPGHLVITDRAPKIEEWQELKGIEDFGAVVRENQLFVIGGFDLRHKRRLDSARCFDPNKRSWRDLPPMTGRRSNFFLAPCRSGLLVSGGQRGRTSVLATSELFLPLEQRWRKAGPLRGPRCGMAGARMDAGLFCCAGATESPPGRLTGTDRVWMYREEGPEGWCELDAHCPQMLSKPITRHAVVSVGTKLYFIGGLKTCTDGRNFEQRTEPLMEAFRPSLGLATKAILVDNGKLRDIDGCEEIEDGEGELFRPANLRDWMTPWDRTLPPPKTSRHNAAAVAFGNSIYLFGGSTTHSASSRGIREVEVFDTLHQTWHTEFRLKEEVGDVSNVIAVFLKFPSWDSNSLAKQIFRQRPSEATGSSTELSSRFEWVLW